MMQIAITGARGRLAPLIARHFAAAGDTVRLFSRQADGNYEDLETLSDPKTWQDIDSILHCGWSTVPLTAEKKPESTDRWDIPLLRAMLAASGVSKPHWVFLSTGAVYGNTGSDPVEETAIPRPLGAYARGKWEAEKILAAANNEAAILRISNLLGEQADPARPQGILPRLIHAAKTGSELALWGDGQATKDYLHCQDFLIALEGVLRQRLSGIWNVSFGESHSLLELVALVEKVAGRSLALRHEAHFDWDVSFSRICNRKLRKHIGWEPGVKIRDAVEECFARFT